MRTVDELLVRVAPLTMFDLAREVERWPEHLPHYRYVRFRARSADGGGVVDMSANRFFGPAPWPTWWRSEMAVDPTKLAVRFRHIAGITSGMDVEWTFDRAQTGVHVRILHVWNGPGWPLVGGVAATHVIGPLFVHAIASRTLAGLAMVAERSRG